MPDLNWQYDCVREDVCEIMQWWIDRGIDGFRLDVINLLSNPPGLPDSDPTDSIVSADHFMNGPKIHAYIREMNDRIPLDDEVLTIGETLDITPDLARHYVVEDGLEMVVPFEHMYIDAREAGPWDIAEWALRDRKTVTGRWQTAIGEGWIGLYLSNHDQPRVVSRFGDDEHGVRDAGRLP